MLAPNGSVIFNNDTSGAGRLRAVVAGAKENGLMVQFVLTNNWSAPNITSITVTLPNGTQVKNARGSYSNGFGGADAWVQFQNLTDHRSFFANQTVIGAFTNNLANLIPPFASESTIMAWELANDARCDGILQDPNSAETCDTMVCISSLYLHLLCCVTLFFIPSDDYQLA